jgi:hypothetical protein
MALTHLERMSNQKAARSAVRQTRANAGWKVHMAALLAVRQDNAARMTRVTLLHRINRLLTDHPGEVAPFAGLIKTINVKLNSMVVSAGS